MNIYVYLFFFQAAYGIRDRNVTGVQTCALPICRHEAELRLKAAETNLNRLEDVIGQLAQQIDALKRQARQAVKYKQVPADVRKAEATLFHLRWVAANAEVAEAAPAKAVSTRRVADATGAQAEASTRQANAAADLPPL